MIVAAIVAIVLAGVVTAAVAGGNEDEAPQAAEGPQGPAGTQGEAWLGSRVLPAR
ncbi:MAG: hypothetical protein ACRDWS_09395 [Acidimicrobiia bacterium]